VVTSTNSDFLMFVLPNLPLVGLWLAGGIWALAVWKRHPPVSLLVLVACSVLLLNLVIGQAVTFQLLQQAGVSRSSALPLIGVVSLVRTGLSVAGYALLLIAAFGWRSAPLSRPTPLERPFPASRPGIDPEGIRKPGSP
jgi:hypothetical protein